eukprot:COSAG02_NODE_7829_length_2831_cov_1.499268_4_plen_338_part_01
MRTGATIVLMMAPPTMQKLGAPLALASALCHVATLVVLMDTRLSIGGARQLTDPQHRSLLDCPPSPPASEPAPHLEAVGRLDKAVDTLGMRLTAVEDQNVELTATLVALRNGHGEEMEHGSRPHDHLTRDLEDAARLNTTRIEYLSIEEVRDRRRRAQGAEPEPEPDVAIGDNVKIIKPAVVRCGGPGGTTSDGHFDYSRCDDRAFARCHAAACNGHRRTQSTRVCKMADLPGRTDEVTNECCNEPGEDCSGGYPHTCNAGCAAVFLPFWDECRAVLGQASSQFEPVARLCEGIDAPAPVGPDSSTLAEQLNVQCTDGTTTCVPDCSGSLHGFLMLLN